MDKSWIKQKNAEQKDKLDKEIAELRKYLKDNSPLLPSEIEQAITYILKEAKDGYVVEHDMMPFWEIVHHRDKYYETEEMRAKFFAALFTAVKGLSSRYRQIANLTATYDRYLDSEPIEFDGDIIITDPCYVIRHDDSYYNDWEKCNYGIDMEALGINRYMTRDTIYGDWACTTFNTDTKKPIGEFCADAGLVSVFLLDEVLKYNPDFNYHIERPWTTTLIKDFKGDVEYDHRICTITTDIEKAKKLKELFSDESEDAYIEEYDENEFDQIINSNFKPYHVRLFKYTHDVIEIKDDLESYSGGWNKAIPHPVWQYPYSVFVQAKDKEQALELSKAALDRYQNKIT